MSLVFKTSSLGRGNRDGFSLLELMIALFVLMIITAAVFGIMSLMTERSSAEQTKLDMFQEAREFMDQMSRDLRLAGYPNPRNYGPGVVPDPVANDLRIAVGLVKIAAGELWFEGDVDGTGTVSVVSYYLDTSTSNGCPCLKRSQVAKTNGNPYTGQPAPSYEIEVQGVTNTNIFSAYNSGTAQTLPLDFNANGAAIAGVDTIQAVLSLQSLALDPKTHKKHSTTLVTTVKLNNCSVAASGQQTSCF